MTRTEQDVLPPDECFQVDDAGRPMACTQQSDGSWTPEQFSPGGPDVGGLFAVGFVLVLALGIGGTLWRMSTARRMARDAGLDEDAAARIALVSEDGLTATYLASSLRDPAAPAPVVRDTATRLRELDRLRAEGLITHDEHASRRAGILDEV